MLIDFFLKVRERGIPASIREFLALLDAMDKGVGEKSIDNFYYLARLTLVKDERHYDRFDQVFGEFFKGVKSSFKALFGDFPEEWLRHELMKRLSDEQKAKAEAMGDLDKLLETLKKRLEEQKGRHQGGNKWIGTGGTSPFGNNGYNPEGIRIGQEGNRNFSAVKVWDKREYRNLDDSIELGTRNLKVALRKLRRFAREGAAEELDIHDTIESTAKNAGLLDIKMVPERHNAVKVLVLFDVGGSMDYHVKTCEELFSAMKTEFKHLKYLYFHNFIYERVWEDNIRRHQETLPTLEVLRTYSADYKVIFVGDATMSPYEIAYPGGSVEHWNEEPGEVWMRRIREVYKHLIWLNPEPEHLWDRVPSIRMTKELVEGQMFPLTVSGLEAGIQALKRKTF